MSGFDLGQPARGGAPLTQTEPSSNTSELPSQASHPSAPSNLASPRGDPQSIETPRRRRSGPPEPPSGEEREEEWLLKSIAWPPLPPRPASSAEVQGFETSELRVKIIQQNRNGPCSLIALCNVLILRNDLQIAPGRDRVTYSYLAALLADYFLEITSTPSVPASPAIAEPDFAPCKSSTRQLSLEAALSILPQTQHGLNLNPQFSRIDGFTTSPTSGEGELALFSLAQIPLLHGWIADPADTETYDVLTTEARDYDRAVEMMVEGSEVAGRLGLEGQGGIELDEEELLKEAERRSQWTHAEEEKVRKAHIIDRFLNATSTQLTYPGLFALSSTPTLLPPSGLAALFRNSHLSVIYRRPRTPQDASTTQRQAPRGPELFTLVTDSSFAGEAEVVWESIEDVDGSASEFFTARLAPSRLKGGDFAGVRNERDLPAGLTSGTAPPREDCELADLALAEQLQAEEEHRAEAYERAEQERYERSAERSHALPRPTSSRHERRESESTAARRPAKSKAEKDKCLVM
ncbi:hypothetical protein JCM11491_001215 [Sporobolomyces phaffii]